MPAPASGATSGMYDTSKTVPVTPGPTTRARKVRNAPTTLAMHDTDGDGTDGDGTDGTDTDGDGADGTDGAGAGASDGDSDIDHDGDDVGENIGRHTR